jgi:hypothetical protein
MRPVGRCPKVVWGWAAVGSYNHYEITAQTIRTVNGYPLGPYGRHADRRSQDQSSCSHLELDTLYSIMMRLN